MAFTRDRRELLIAHRTLSCGTFRKTLLTSLGGGPHTLPPDGGDLELVGGGLVTVRCGFALGQLRVGAAGGGAWGLGVQGSGGLHFAHSGRHSLQEK